MNLNVVHKYNPDVLLCYSGNSYTGYEQVLAVFIEIQPKELRGYARTEEVGRSQVRTLASRSWDTSW